MSNHEELLGRLENPITEELHGYAAVLLGETMGLAADVIREQQAEIKRLNNNVECLLLGIALFQSGPDPRDLLNESVAMVSKSLEGKS